MLDSDLASIYGVETRVLNQAVRRNIERFPEDFRMELTRDEVSRLSQIVITSRARTNIKFAPRVTAFTEHGAVMLAAVLKSPRAVAASVIIARAFIRLRKLSFGRRELSARLKELERRVGTHDGDIQSLFNALGAMIEGPKEAANRIGFQP
jgi:hypothetical protein